MPSTTVDLSKQYLEGLTYKQKLFVEYYQGNALEAAKQAGYAGNNNTLGQIGHKLVNNGKICQALMVRDNGDQEKVSKIISREEMEEELTKIVRGNNGYHEVKPQERIKAMERLAKMRGYDKETIELTGSIETLTNRQLDNKLQQALIIVGLPESQVKQLKVGKDKGD